MASIKVGEQPQAEAATAPAQEFCESCHHMVLWPCRTQEQRDFCPALKSLRRGQPEEGK